MHEFSRLPPRAGAAARGLEDRAASSRVRTYARSCHRHPKSAYSPNRRLLLFQRPGRRDSQRSSSPPPRGSQAWSVCAGARTRGRRVHMAAAASLKKRLKSESDSVLRPHPPSTGSRLGMRLCMTPTPEWGRRLFVVTARTPASSLPAGCVSRPYDTLKLVHENLDDDPADPSSSEASCPSTTAPAMASAPASGQLQQPQFYAAHSADGRARRAGDGARDGRSRHRAVDCAHWAHCRTGGPGRPQRHCRIRRRCGRRRCSTTRNLGCSIHSPPMERSGDDRARGAGAAIAPTAPVHAIAPNAPAFARNAPLLLHQR